MLQGVLTAFSEAVSILLRHQVEKRSILENLDLVVLALDETVDNGLVQVAPSCFLLGATVDGMGADGFLVRYDQDHIGDGSGSYRFSSFAT